MSIEFFVDQFQKYIVQTLIQFCFSLSQKTQIPVDDLLKIIKNKVIVRKTQTTSRKKIFPLQSLIQKLNDFIKVKNYRDREGNEYFEHLQTGFLLDKINFMVIGKKDQTPFDETDIIKCKELNLYFSLPLNLSNQQTEDKYTREKDLKEIETLYQRLQGKSEEEEEEVESEEEEEKEE